MFLRDKHGHFRISGDSNGCPVFRKRVRFDRAAEFLAACASGDTEEAKAMLEETEQSKSRNGENLPDIISCSNADGITALHQVTHHHLTQGSLSFPLDD